ncbi:MAG: RnfABCDGE type electron transport complex subunit D [Bacilli bacterium]
MNGKKFVLGKAPFIRKADLTSQHTSSFMRDLVIALIPLIIFGWVKNGLVPFLNDDTNFYGMIHPLLLPILGGLFSLLLEYGWWGFIVKKRPLEQKMATSYAIIPGLMLGMIVTVSTPIWVLFIGTIFATVIAKLLFGGFGHNIFNPALIGFVFLTTYSYFGLMGGATSFGSKGFLNPTEAITVGATPLSAIKNPAEFANIFVGYEAMLEKYGILNLFLGFNPGVIAETSALLCLVGLIYLLVRKVINWRIPVIYIGTVFVLTYIIGAINGYAGTLNFALFNIFSGGLMFGAVFMATEPVTSPRNPNGKIIYALGLGVLTVVFRFASNNPEGVAVSILALNMFTAIIERFATKLRVEPNKKKMVLSYTLVGLLLAGISVFPVVKSIVEPVVMPEFEYVESSQDYKSFDFVYKFTSNGEEFTVTTAQDFTIKQVSNQEFDNAESKEELAKLINDNKIRNFVQSANEGADYLELTIITGGFAGAVTNVITYDNDFVITDFVVTYNESYPSGEWQNVGGGVHPKDKIPGDIIANQDDLSSVGVVAGATVTSNAIKNAVGVAQAYVDYLDTITELTLVGVSQDLETLEFVYVFRDADSKTIVTTDTDYEITSTVPAEILADVEAAIDANKFDAYYVSKTETTIVVRTKGFKNPITTTFTFDEEFKITAVETNDLKNETTGESYMHGEWSDVGGGIHPQDKIPTEIVSKQADLSEVEVVSGASVTSRAIVKAANMALDYLKYLEGTDE